VDCNKIQQKTAYNKYFNEYEESVGLVHLMLKPYTIDKWKNICKDKDILEIGCGNAYCLNQLKLSGIDFKTYTGIDISEEIIRNNSREHANSGNITFLVDNAEKLESISNGQYDLILSFGCLHHLQNPEKCVKKASEKLKQGGRFFAVELNRDHSASSFVGLYSSILGLDPEKTRKICKKAAKKVCSSKKRKTNYDNYIKNHPGHPGKRTPAEYENIFKNAGFKDREISCLYLDLFPYAIYRVSMLVFKLMVCISQRLIKFKKLKDIGSIILISAKK